jgi:hypothetical protein
MAEGGLLLAVGAWLLARVEPAVVARDHRPVTFDAVCTETTSRRGTKPSSRRGRSARLGHYILM